MSLGHAQLPGSAGSPAAPKQGRAGARAGAQAEAPRLRAPQAGSQSREADLATAGKRVLVGWLQIPHEGPASEAPPPHKGPCPYSVHLDSHSGPAPVEPGCVCVSRGCRVSASSSAECRRCLGAVLRVNRVQEAWSGLPFPIRGGSLGRCCQLPWSTRGAQGTRPPGPILCLYWARQVPSPTPLTSPPEDVGQILIQVGKVPTQLGKPPNPPSPPHQAPRLSPLPSIRGPPAPLQPACPPVSSGLWALAASSGWPLC